MLPLHRIIVLDSIEPAAQKLPPLIGHEKEREEALLQDICQLILSHQQSVLSGKVAGRHTYYVACDRTRTAGIKKI